MISLEADPVLKAEFFKYTKTMYTTPSLVLRDMMKAYIAHQKGLTTPKMIENFGVDKFPTAGGGV